MADKLIWMFLLFLAFVIIDRPFKFIKEPASKDDTDISNNVEENLLRKKREIVNFNSTESTNQRLTGGPSLTHTESTSQRLVRGPNITHTESTNQRLVGGPSLTYTLHSYSNNAKQDEGGGNRHFLETIPSIYHNATLQEKMLEKTRRKRWDTNPQQKSDRKVDTICVNPVINKVDVCIESMDKKVAEKCLPGINNMLDQLEKQHDESKPGLYNLKARESEVCLRDVFSKCTYESRFKIKTKIKQLVGVNLDIAFQEEFEMDCCDQDFMKENLENAEDCFKKLNAKPPELKCKPEEVSTELLQITGECIDDHTAFSCLTATTELFKDTMRELVQMLRKETLELLEQIGEDKYPHGRLCLKWIDYDRLQECEPDFFDYVLCLKNGTHVPGLYEKVVGCFQRALRVCPPSTIKLLIKITAGAIEGKGGEQIDKVRLKVNEGPSDQWNSYEEGPEDKWISGKGRPGDKWKPDEEWRKDIWKPDERRPGDKWGPDEGRPGDKWGPDEGRPGDKWGPDEVRPGGKWKPGEVRPGGKWKPGEVRPGGKWKPDEGRPGDKWGPDEGRPGDKWGPDDGRPGDKWGPDEVRPGDKWGPDDGRPGDKWGPGEVRPGGKWKPGEVRPGGKWKPGEGRPSDKWTPDEGRPGDKWGPDEGRPGDKWGPDEVRPGDKWGPDEGRPGDKWGPGDKWIPGGAPLPRIKVPNERPDHRKPSLYEVEELPHLPNKWSVKPRKHCGPKVIEVWIRETEECFKTELQQTKETNFEKVFAPLHRCFREKRPKQCKFRKASEFFECCNKIPDLITSVVTPDEKVRTCIDDLKSPKIKQCQAQLFMYYVSLHHAHYTKEAREKILSKAKLCFKVNLRNCPQSYIDNLLRFFLAVNNIGLPDIEVTKMVTRVTIPEGYIWCETRIISSELPVPSTTQIQHTISPTHEQETITPTSTRRVKVTIPTTVKEFTPPPLTTREFTFPPQPTKFGKQKTPTTIFEEKVTPPTRWQTEIRPPKPTREEIFTPPSKGFSEWKTPTTVRYFTLTPPTFVPRKTFPPPKTRFFTRTPVVPTLTEIRTPTTIVQQTLTPPTTEIWKTKRIPTFQTRYPPQPRTFSRRFPFTTEVVTRTPHIPLWTFTRRPPMPSIITIPPQPTIWSKVAFPTTTRVTRFPPKPRTFTEELGTTTVKVHFSEEVPLNCYSALQPGPCKLNIQRWYYKPETGTCETFTWGGCKPNGNNFETKEECEETCARKTVTTRVYEWTPPGKIERKSIRPTTIEVETRTPPVKVPSIFIPRPRTTEIYYSLPPVTMTRIISPTTYHQIKVTPPQVWKPKTKPPRPTYIQTFTPKPPTDCYSPKEHGPCENKIPRWYWNKVLRTCQRFIWGGCKPNGNNFETIEECEDTCGRRTVTTRIYKWTPEVSRWENKRTETTVNIFVKEKTPSITYEVVRPSPTTRVFTFIPPILTYSQPFRPSTVKIYTMTVTGTQTHVRPTPSTIREVFTAPSQIFTFTRPQTTSQVFTQRITPGIWRKTRTPPPVKVFTVPPPERTVTQYIPPTRTRTFEIPHTTKVYEFTRPPIPHKVKTFPPMPFTYEERYTPTTVKQFSITPKPRTYSMQEESTTIKVKISELPGRTFTATRPPKVPSIITSPPSDCFSPKKCGPCKNRITRWFYNKVTNQCEKFIYSGCEGNANNFRTKEECEQTCMIIRKTLPTVRVTEYTLPPVKTVKTGPPITTRKETWPPQETQFSVRFTPPTYRTITQTIPPEKTEFTKPPIPPKIITMTYPTKILHYKLTPTTSRIVKYTIPPKVYTQKVQSTTVNVGVSEENIYTMTEEYVPQTEEFVFPPDTKKESREKLPTTVRCITEIITPRTFKKIRTPPSTIEEIFTPPEKTITHEIIPTTIATFEVPFSVSHKVYKPPVPTLVFTATPPEITRTRRITPSTTELWTAPPKPRTSVQFTLPPRKPIIEVKTPTEVEWKTRIVVTPELQTYTGSPPEYTCVYPTPPSTTVCEMIPRKCLPGEEIVWREKILNCTLSQAKKKGVTIYKLIVKDKNLNELKKIVEYCVKCIGDTICRNTTFPLAEWMLDKVNTYVGEYGERADTIDIINDDVYHEMKQCVIMADESLVERCYPGLYQAMTDLILYEKPTRMIKYRKTQEGCLQEVFRHCKRFPKFKIEEKLENVFEFCIKITESSERSFCKDRGPPKKIAKVEKRKCKGHDTDKIVIDVENCLEKEIRNARSQKKIIKVQEILEISVKCLGTLHCEVGDINDMTKSLSLLIKLVAYHLDYDGKPKGRIVIENTGSLCHQMCHATGGKCRENVGKCVCSGSIEFSHQVGCIPNQCARSLGGIELRQCFKSVEGALRRIDELQDRDALIRQVTRCMTNALRGCNSGTIRLYAKYFVKMICSSCQVPEIAQTRKIGYEITHVGVTPSGVDVCGNVFRTEEAYFRSLRPRVEDDCVPIESEGKGSIQVRVPACGEEKVDKWLRTVKECMEKKVTNIGLRNPDYLTLEKVIQILKDCEEPLSCRAKYREDFKKIMSVLLLSVTTNVLAETDEQRNIRNALNYDKMGVKCKSILYKYLTFDTTEEQLKRSKAKGVECLQNSLKGVGSDVLDDLLDAFEIGMVMDENKIEKMFQEHKLEKCDSEEQVKERVYFYNAPSYMNCGPGGVLVRKERNLESQQYETSAFSQNLATEKVPFLNPVVKRASFTDCTAEDFTRYFEQLLKCGHKKLHLKFRRKRNKCKLNDLKHSWTALVDCMIENIGDELTCQVTTEEQMTEYLQHVSRTLHTSLQSIDDSCPIQQTCYGTEAPALSTCSNVYLQLLETKEADVPMRDILDGSFDVLECLKEIWPNCPPEVQFTALQFLYLPLGLNYDSSINQGLKFVSCDESLSPENSSYSRCMGKGGINEIEEEPSDSSIETCMSCVKQKEGICISSSDKDLVNRLGTEFTRINRCLKRIISDDNCLKDMTTRIQDKCMSDFYRLYKNTTKGIVLNSIEYFSKFNNCLIAFKSECPEDYRRLTLHLYYDILGLSTVFKPQFLLENDTIR